MSWPARRCTRVERVVLHDEPHRAGIARLVLREDRLVLHVRLTAGGALVVVELDDQHLGAVGAARPAARAARRHEPFELRLLVLRRLDGARRRSAGADRRPRAGRTRASRRRRPRTHRRAISASGLVDERRGGPGRHGGAMRSWERTWPRRDTRNSPMTATYVVTHSRHTVFRMKNDA